MSKDIIVLTPNGRRQKVHCTPDTNILQVLEDVCEKQGFQPTEYNLKHHNHILDLTNTIRFSNLPNKATLEMVEAEKKREESSVTIGLILEDGDRRTGDFLPNTSLFELVNSLAAAELNIFQNPTITYMRQEVIGVPALKDKTLRQLGLIGGRAMLRLFNKPDEPSQANVSAVYRCPLQEKHIEQKEFSPNENPTEQMKYDNPTPGPSGQGLDLSKPFDPIKLLRKHKEALKHQGVTIEEETDTESKYKDTTNTQIKMDVDDDVPAATKSSNTSQQILERRLKIDDEVTFLGEQKAIAFMQPEEVHDELEDLPDDFYDLSLEEVRRLYHDLQQSRIQLENTPLVTATKREELQNQASQMKLNVYKNVVVRIQFPDRMILQGVFSPNNTIEMVTNFVKSHLDDPHKPFVLSTTPLKETLDPKLTLAEAKFVPCVHMHFKWVHDDTHSSYLKKEIYRKMTTSEAASILASKYRAPSRRKIESSSQNCEPGTSKKVPRWFKK